MKYSEVIRSPKMREIFRFCLTGVVSTITTYSVYYVMLLWLNPSLSFTIGYGIAFIVNYVLTTTFTFKVKATAKNGIGFVVSNIINYFLYIVVLNVFIAVGISKELAPIPMYAICIPINYIIVRFVMKSM